MSKALLATWRTRFEAHPARHPRLTWRAVEARLVAAPKLVKVLAAMEASGGEPDVVGQEKSGAVIFFDCAAESPKGRRSLCYDRAAHEARKEHKPEGSAVEAARAMGAELLSEEQYLYLQTLGEFDRKTESWILTPPAIRELEGALYGERRFGRVFIGANGPQSYFAGRGFRCVVRV